MKPILIIILSLNAYFVQSQDTLTLQNRFHHSRIVRIPADQFPVHIRVHNGGAHKTYIKTITRDSITFRYYDYGSKRRKEFGDNIKNIKGDTSLSNSDKHDLIKDIKYQTTVTVRIADIEKFVLKNKYRKDQTLMKSVIRPLTFLATLGSATWIFASNPKNLQLNYYGLGVFGAAATGFVLMDSKKINMKYWKILR